LPLGLLISSGYDAHQLTLVPDFRLVIVTDGVLEGLGNKTLAEREAQLLSFVERDAGEAQGWLNRFLGDSDESLTDDASVLCVTGLRSR
ncbi:MAG: SpoIIE family protein phosphatase, partial [Pseudomonadales bacterium]